MNFAKSTRSLAAASILALGLVGCGGGGHVSVPPTNNPTPVAVTGGVTPVAVTTTTDIPASDTPGLTTITLPGDATPSVVALATGDAIPAGTPLAIIPSGTAFIDGLNGGARDPGDVRINGRLIRSHVVNGKLTPAVAIPTGHYTLTVEGPFTITSNGSTLTMQSAAFVFDCNGHQLSLPTGIDGHIPANGSDNWTNTLTATFAAPYNTGDASLTITHANGTLNQTRTVVASGDTGSCVFHDFQEDQQSHIPSQGVNTVTFTH